MHIYTQRDLRRVTRTYGDLTVLASPRETSGIRGIDLKRLRIRAGERTSVHRHLVAESVFFVVVGKLNVWDDTAVLGTLREGEVLIVTRGEQHCLENISENTAIVVEVQNPPYEAWDIFPRERRVSRRKRMTRNGGFWQSDGELRVKVCGVRNLEAVVMCREAGVHAVGVNVTSESKGLAKFHEWLEWVPRIPRELSVFVLTDTHSVEELELLASSCGVDTVQLQGNMDVDIVSRLADACRAAGWRVVKSVGIGSMRESEVADYVGTVGKLVDGVLLDSSWRGGTGVVASTSVVREVLAGIEVPCILAGGLSSENLEAVVPDGVFGIDVESGVEERLLGEGDGGHGRGVAVKSADRIRELMRTVRKLRKS